MLGGRVNWCPPSLHIVTCAYVFLCVIVITVFREQLPPHQGGKRESDGDKVQRALLVPCKAPFVWRSSTILALRGLPHVMTLNCQHSYHLLLTTSPPPHERTASGNALLSIYITRSLHLCLIYYTCKQISALCYAISVSHVFRMSYACILSKSVLFRYLDL